MSQYSYLATIRPPVFQENRLRIVTESAIAQNLLNKAELLGVIDREASQLLGQEMKSDVVPTDKFDKEEKPAGPTDKLDKLIERGSKYNNITLE